MDLRIAGLVNDSIVDGPGFRLAVFTQGCSHRCPGCQNEHTWDPAGGETVTVDDLLAKVDRNPLLKGVTLTGGEPFEQAAPLIGFAQACHERGLDVWAYSGYTYEQLAAGKAGEDARALLAECDVLVDGPFVEAEKSLMLKWRGSANQRVIDVRRSLDAGEAVELEL